jgi:hypothetical protein
MMADARDEVAVLRRFISLQLGPPAPTAPSVEARTAVALALLLDDTPGRDCAHFCRFQLPRLLQHLTRRTESTRTVRHGRVRGRVEWPATIKARHSGEYDPTRFVCREVQHQFDTPENQLLVAFVELLDTAYAAIPAWLRDGTLVTGAAPEDATGDRVPATQRRLAALRVDTQRARRNIYLRQVTPPPVVTDEHRRRARHADLPEYGRALALYAHLESHLLRPDSPAARAYADGVFRHILPLPAALSPRAESWLQQMVALLGVQGRE